MRCCSPVEMRFAKNFHFLGLLFTWWKSIAHSIDLNVKTFLSKIANRFLDRHSQRAKKAGVKKRVKHRKIAKIFNKLRFWLAFYFAYITTIRYWYSLDERFAFILYKIGTDHHRSFSSMRIVWRLMPTVLYFLRPHSKWSGLRHKTEVKFWNGYFPLKISSVRFACAVYTVCRIPYTDG